MAEVHLPPVPPTGLIGEPCALCEFPKAFLSLCWMMEEMTLLSRTLPAAAAAAAADRCRNAAGGGGSSVMGLGLLLGVDAFGGI